ncbi:MAG: GDP-mannose 4,6-dehydratase [Chlamydiae bacterium]|nr:GDP-mannose 4,6-dehydratase [Chlamydiota bacterium]MBI3277339.1 GDP-mannose 4,6-dehydratase [Chlamydiota bacterium]
MKSLKRFYQGRPVLVTGGAGFVGSHLAEALIRWGAKVSIFDNLSRGKESLRNLEEIKQSGLKFKWIQGDVLDLKRLKSAARSVDMIFHFAALPSHRLAMSDPRGYALVDIMGTVNVLETARLSTRPVKILFASSNKVYGKQPPPFKEDAKLFPEGPYGQAKMDAEEWCHQYSRYYGLSVVVTRLHHIIGPRSQPDLALSIFVERILSNQEPIVHGQFKGKRFIPCAAAFTNVYDAVPGILRSMVKADGFDILNIGAAKETSVLELAQLARKILNSEVGIQKRQMFPHESLHHAADPSKAKKVLGWQAETPVETSVKQYIDWRLEVGRRKAANYKEKL